MSDIAWQQREESSVPLVQRPKRWVAVFWGASAVAWLGSAAAVALVSSGGVSRLTVMFGAAAAGFAVLISFGLNGRATRKILDTYTVKIIQLFVSSALGLCVLEIGLRQLSPPSPFHPLLPLRPYQRMEHQVDLPGVAPRSLFTTNKWGLRGEDPPRLWKENYTIVTIGGSTTHCFYLDNEKEWPHLLQQRLRAKDPNVWVGNGGLDGHSTRGHLIFMREAVSKICPDAVILLIGANDLSLSMMEDRRLNGNPFDTFDDSRAEDGARRVLRMLFHKSRIVQLLYTWKQILFGEAILVEIKGHGPLQPRPLPDGYQSLPSNLEELLPQLDEFRRNVRAIIAGARAHGIRPIFLTQPLRFGDTAFDRGILASHYWHDQNQRELSAADYWRLLDTYNRTLIDVCRSENVKCFDLASRIPHEGEYFYDAAHFTELGAAKVADEVAQFLLESDQPWPRETKPVPAAN